MLVMRVPLRRAGASAALLRASPRACRALSTSPAPRAAGGGEGEAAARAVGVLGLGRMGSALARNLLAAGHALHVFDRNPAATEALLAHPAAAENRVRVAGSVREVGLENDVVLSMLPNDEVLRQVTGEEGGEGSLLHALQPGGLHISCSTVSPLTSRALSKLYVQQGKRFLAAPVFARPENVDAKQANFVMSSADETAMEEAKPLLQTSAATMFDFGSDPGAANVVKLAGNFLIATTIESMSEALAFAEDNLVDRQQLYEMLTSTIFDCVIHKGYGHRVSNRDHRPGGFALELGRKDVTLVSEVARASDTPMPYLSVLLDRYTSAVAKGRSDLDWSAIGLNVSEDAGVDVGEFEELCREDMVQKDSEPSK